MPSPTAAPDPTELAALDLEALRVHRQLLIDQEQLLSYWRRVVQGRLDLLDVSCDGAEHLTVPDLVDALGGGDGSERRPALLWALPQPMEVIPGIGDIWLHPLDPHDAGKVAELRRASTDAEVQLSARRQIIFGQLDAATAELVRRYACEPEAALDLLPGTEIGPPAPQDCR